MKSLKNKLKVLNKRGERSGFFLFFHGFKRVRNEPLFDFVVGYTFEDKGVTE